MTNQKKASNEKRSSLFCCGVCDEEGIRLPPCRKGGLVVVAFDPPACLDDLAPVSGSGVLKPDLKN